MRVFLTGGTGYVGAPILKAVAKKHDVAALVLSNARAAEVATTGATPVIGDLARPDDWVTQALAADAVIHAGIASGPARLDIDRACRIAFHPSRRSRQIPRRFRGRALPRSGDRRAALKRARMDSATSTP